MFDFLPDVPAPVSEAWAGITARWVEAPTLAGLSFIAVLLLALGTAAFAVYTPTWRVLRYGVTVVHEAGHAIAGLTVGRRIGGITLSEGAGGITTSAGHSRLGQIWTSWWGYPAPAFAGYGLVLAAGTGNGARALLGALVVLVFVLLLSRNLLALGVVLGAGAVLGSVYLYGSPGAATFTVFALGWVLLVGSARSLATVAAAHLPGRRNEKEFSDAYSLAKLTAIPSVVWLTTFLVAVGGSFLAALTTIGVDLIA